MQDQASYLRRLMREATVQAPSSPADAVRLIAVVGGKTGLGSTTVALAVSVALAQQGQRVALVDADLKRGRLAEECHLADGDNLLDILHGRRDVHEVLQRGPCGIQVLPGSHSLEAARDVTRSAQDRLIWQLRGLGRHVETVVLDIGSGHGLRARRFAEQANALLLVTTPDPHAVFDTYAVLKLMATSEQPRWHGVAVNRATDAEEGQEIAQRLTLCARRFLSKTLHYAGALPERPEGELFDPTAIAATAGESDNTFLRAIPPLAHVLATATGTPLPTPSELRWPGASQAIA